MAPLRSIRRNSPARTARAGGLILLGCWLAACSIQSKPPTQPEPEPSNGSAGSAPSGTGGAQSSGEAPVGGTASGATTSAGGSATAGSPGDTAQPRMCGGIAGLQCGPKEYCSFAPEAHCGAADQSGTCAKMPDACIQLVDEVCGCDDKTYSNACMAAQAGVSVIAKGPCATKSPDTIAEGKLCGTRGVRGECAPGLYCAYRADCGRTDLGGLCTKRTTVCTKIYKPVCGCDGKTYGNACTAATAGVTVASDGACKSP